MDSGVDTLSRWMAHYVAEKIMHCEAAQGAEKAALEKECFDLILKLWKHRECFQHRKPMQSFAPIFAMLRKLHGPNLHHYYLDTHSIKDGNDESWLNLAHSLDFTARDLIRWCLAMASAEIAASEEQWLSSTAPLAFEDADDVIAAKSLLEDSQFFKKLPTEFSASDIAELSNMQKRFNAFVTFSNHLSKQFEALIAEAGSDDNEIK